MLKKGLMLYKVRLCPPLLRTRAAVDMQSTEHPHIHTVTYPPGSFGLVVPVALLGHTVSILPTTLNVSLCHTPQKDD